MHLLVFDIINFIRQDACICMKLLRREEIKTSKNVVLLLVTHHSYCSALSSVLP